MLSSLCKDLLSFLFVVLTEKLSFFYGRRDYFWNARASASPLISFIRTSVIKASLISERTVTTTAQWTGALSALRPVMCVQQQRARTLAADIIFKAIVTGEWSVYSL